MLITSTKQYSQQKDSYQQLYEEDEAIVGRTVFRMKHMFRQAERYGHAFCWGEDYEKEDGEIGKCYNSATDIDTFIRHYYLKLKEDERWCYELVQKRFYMFFDLDLNIPADAADKSVYTEMNLFKWFDGIFSEFFSHLRKKCPDDQSAVSRLTRSKLDSNKPDWIVTTASNEHKLSLHLVNRNVIFENNGIFKQFYSHLEAFIRSFVDPSHPFFGVVDVSVASNNRLMRLCGSAKYKSNRVLRPFTPLHPNGLNLRDTFICAALEDDSIGRKYFGTNVANTLFSPTILNGPSSNPSSAVSDTNKKATVVFPKASDNQLVELLAILSDKRADQYQSWMNIAFIFKQHNLPYSIFEDFSKRSPKFDPEECQKGWDNITPKSIDKPLTLGTIHFYAKEDNPEKYDLFKAKYQVVSLDLTFTPDKTITEKFIPRELYSDSFNRHNIIALKSCMMTGKTYTLPPLFSDPKYNSIVVVYFRVSLSKELMKKWESLGFALYSDLKGAIKLKDHPRVIIQVDSLPRLQGKTDLLILDEIESTYTHLCSSTYLNHQECYNTLKNYIQYTPKVLLADANLSDETLNALLKKRMDQTVKVLNTYQSFTHISANIFSDQEAFREQIIELLQQNKRLVIPTNSKSFSKKIDVVIRKMFPEKKVLLVNSEGGRTDSDKWSDYDVLIYTPTIVAGVSFDKVHFHACCAYFINRSSNAEMSSQMLVRVRHLIDNKMVVFCSNDFNLSSGPIPIPLTKIDITKYINERIRNGHLHSNAEGLEIHRFEERVVRNQYFNLYCAYIRKRNLSRLFFKRYICEILRFHGVKITHEAPKNNLEEEEKKALHESVHVCGEVLKKEYASAVIASTPISREQFRELIGARQEKTKDQQLSIARHYLTSTMELKSNDYLRGLEEWVSKTLPRLKGINNFKEFLDKLIQEAILLAEKRHQFKYDTELLQQAEDYDSRNYSSDTSEPDREDDGEADGESDDDRKRMSKRANMKDKRRVSTEFEFQSVKKYKRVIQKHNVKQTVVHSIHYDRKWLKIKICLEMLKAAGFTVLNNSEKRKLDWNSLHQYCKENEEKIRVLFDVDKKIWKDEIDANEKKGLMKYANSKLEQMLAINIKANNKLKGKDPDYSIAYCFNYIEQESKEEIALSLQMKLISYEEEIIDEDTEDEIPSSRLLTRSFMA